MDTTERIAKWRELHARMMEAVDDDTEYSGANLYGLPLYLEAADRETLLFLCRELLRLEEIGRELKLRTWRELSGGE